MQQIPRKERLNVFSFSIWIIANDANFLTPRRAGLGEIVSALPQGKTASSARLKLQYRSIEVRVRVKTNYEDLF
jgi:hypothetical protein